MRKFASLVAALSTVLWITCGLARAQYGPVQGDLVLPSGQTVHLSGNLASPTPSPTPTPSPSPTPNPCDFTLTSPADLSTVTVPVTLHINVPGKPNPARWINYYAGYFLTSGSVATGDIPLTGPFVRDWTVITARELGPGVPTTCTPQSVMVKISAATPTPSPTATPTPSPSPTPTPPPIVGEFRPENTPYNQTVPPAAWLASYKQGVANGLGGDKRGVELAGPWLQQVDGQHAGTTQDIVNFYVAKYSQITGIPIDPLWIMAELYQETEIYQAINAKGQAVVGDIGNGMSLGAPQIKSSDYWPTCPTVAKSQNIADINAADCMSHLSTPLAMDFFMNHYAGCLTGQMANYIHNGRDFSSDTTQHPGITYPNYDTMVAQAKGAAAGSAAVKFAEYSCSGQWYSGAYLNAGAIAYANFVQGYFNNPPWLNSTERQTRGWSNPRKIKGYGHG